MQAFQLCMVLIIPHPAYTKKNPGIFFWTQKYYVIMYSGEAMLFQLHIDFQILMMTKFCYCNTLINSLIIFRDGYLWIFSVLCVHSPSLPPPPPVSGGVVIIFLGPCFHTPQRPGRGTGGRRWRRGRTPPHRSRGPGALLDNPLRCTKALQKHLRMR